MDRKRFLAFFSAIIVLFLATSALRHYRPDNPRGSPVGEFPLQKDGWLGEKDNLVPGMVDMLNPTLIFSAAYTNQSGRSVHLFFDYFESRNTRGGPHSPRNCLPGSGWIIRETRDRQISIGGRTITVGRFDLGFGESRKVMDFWYITEYGETFNDYLFKLHLMISALTFKPGDIAFVRIIGDGDPEGLAALDDFERLFVGEIYDYLNFR
jgi:EpsI family protein